MNQKLFIVIPVHNRVNLTRNFLLSLRRQTRTDFTVIVIDDGSTDGTSEMVQGDFPEVVLLRGDGNLWWSRATNLGVQYALDHGAKYLMTVNDDTVLADDFIEKMLYWAEREPRVLLGAMALDSATRQPVYGGERINWWSAGYVKVLDLVAPEDRHGLHEATHLPGRGLLIPAEVFHKIGLFAAKRLPQSMADFDFTLRAVRAGYRAFCNYDAKVFVFPETIAGLHFRREKSWRNYFNHLFGIKGSGNLIFFFFYAVRNCPTHLLPFYLTVGSSRRILGYLRDWSIETVKASMKKVAA
jgi:GT2 family glycosyltransferase